MYACHPIIQATANKFHLKIKVFYSRHAELRETNVYEGCDGVENGTVYLIHWGNHFDAFQIVQNGLGRISFLRNVVTYGEHSIKTPEAYTAAE